MVLPDWRDPLYDEEEAAEYEDYHSKSEREEPRFLGVRVSNLGANVSAWCEETKNGSSDHDLCLDCAAKLERNPHHFDGILLPHNGDPVGEDGWGGDVEHPLYNDWNIYCANPTCKVLLGD